MARGPRRRKSAAGLKSPPSQKSKVIHPKKTETRKDDDDPSSDSDSSSTAPLLLQSQEKTATPVDNDDAKSTSSESVESENEPDAPNNQNNTPADDDDDDDENSVSTEESESESEPSLPQSNQPITSPNHPQHSPTPTNPPTTPLPPLLQSDGRYHNKRRCLILSSRGITSRQRHLLEDFRTLIPHHKKEGKLDVGNNAPGGIGRAIDDIAEMRGCNSVLFLECRKRQDAYLWIGGGGVNRGGKEVGIGGGPSAKFLVENVHTMDELRLTGNCMKGSRPLLAFDAGFGQREELKLLKCLFTDVFGTPRGHPKSKPFVDRVMGFYYVDGKIWVRNYQIVETTSTTAKEAQTEKKLHGQAHSTSMVEIGPRFVLNPIRIFRGSFGGQTLFQNQAYVSPNAVRSARARDRGQDYKERKDSQDRRKKRKESIVVPEDPLGKVFA